MIFTRIKEIKKHSKSSFSQCGEDLIIQFIFNALGIEKPSYIDIGAHHPFYLSNTALFYAKGSRGINIEPDPQLYELFRKYRPEDVNLNCGVADHSDTLTFHIFDVPSMNTFSADAVEEITTNHQFKVIKKIPVPVQTLNSILHNKNNDLFPDFMSLDVEGLDEEIIRSIVFEDKKPVVICIETISYSEKGEGKKNDLLIRYLCEKGYIVYADTYINTIFVLKEKWLKQ